MSFAFKLTGRTFTGFGEATNEAVLASLGGFRRFCTDQNEYLFHLLGPARLLQLPDGLLLQIALYIDSAEQNQDLRHLALTSRRFRNIAREAIICNGIVMLRSVRVYLLYLFQYPELAPKLSSRLHLHSSRSRTRPTTFDRYTRSKPHKTLDQFQLFQDCSTAINQSCVPSAFAKWVQEISQNGPYARDVSLMGLLLVQPQLQELTVSDVFIEDCVMFSALTTHRSFGPFPSVP